MLSLMIGSDARSKRSASAKRSRRPNSVRAKTAGGAPRRRVTSDAAKQPPMPQQQQRATAPANAGGGYYAPQIRSSERSVLHEDRPEASDGVDVAEVERDHVTQFAISDRKDDGPEPSSLPYGNLDALDKWRTARAVRRRNDAVRKWSQGNYSGRYGCVAPVDEAKKPAAAAASTDGKGRAGARLWAKAQIVKHQNVAVQKWSQGNASRRYGLMVPQ